MGRWVTTFVSPSSRRSADASRWVRAGSLTTTSDASTIVSVGSRGARGRRRLGLGDALDRR